MLARLVCPIGIGGIRGKHPREIAVSVAAELLGLGFDKGGSMIRKPSISIITPPRPATRRWWRPLLPYFSRNSGKKQP